MESAPTALTKIELSSLTKVATGKVRELYHLDDETLLFVASDRISAYDVVLDNGIPFRGTILTLITAHWLDVLSAADPRFKHHLLSLAPPTAVSPSERSLIKGRAMQVRRLQPFKIEAIVRGYLTGSAWNEYRTRGTVHGLPQPAGLQQCAAFPSGPIYTPSTKADQGEHDQNITPDEAAAIVGEGYGPRIEKHALRLYSVAAAYARERGIIIADVKFEFALDPATDDIVLIDEVLTPDSSRFWPADAYEPGRDQDSFDKQLVRNWLTDSGLKGKQGVVVPDDVARATTERYRDVFQRLTGKTVEEAVAALEGW